MWNISYIKRQMFLILAKIKVWTELQFKAAEWFVRVEVERTCGGRTSYRN